MPVLKKTYGQMKRDCVKAILTRLKPNVYIDKHHYWEQLETGLNRMSISQIDALEALMMNKIVTLDDEDYVLHNLKPTH